jgi:type IX secretion system PorP/SprF family membrane protein
MKKLITLVFLFVTSLMHCQKESEYTQHMYNAITINPAYAGSRGTSNLFAQHRLQWVGINGAPIKTSVSANMPAGKNVGLGFTILNEKIGPSIENNLSIDFSYTIPVFKTYKLAFGIKGTAGLLNVDFNKLTIEDPGDYVFENNIDNQFSPNIGLGLYLYSDKSYFGISTPFLLETEHFDKYATADADSYIVKDNINLYVMAGHIFVLNSSIEFKPTVMLNAVKNEDPIVEISGNLLFNKKFTTGLNYNWGQNVGALLGFQATDSWFFGYLYSMETTELSNYNSGSHEFFLRWELFPKNNKILTSRFF